MKIVIIPNDKGNPPGNLADIELHFSDQSPLAGLKLIGFAVWEHCGGAGRHVTLPARQYLVNGERRSFALLRPTGDVRAQERIRNLILDAYARWERDAYPLEHALRNVEPATMAGENEQAARTSKTTADIDF